jgi:hypothetical protein
MKRDREKAMRVLGNAAALAAALSLIGGLILAQRDYQNSWREPSVIQASSTLAANGGAHEGAAEYKVVMK